MKNSNFSERKVVLIGASTGGPGQIERILSSLDEDFDASIVIAQHMGSEYIKSFAKALDERSVADVKTAPESVSIDGKTVYVCTEVCSLRMESGSLKIVKEKKNPNGYNPDIDTLFKSAAALKGEYEFMSVILTGIGSDGSEGCSELLSAGFRSLAADENSCVVFGMPKNAKERDERVEMMSLDAIIDEIRKFGSANV